MKKNILIGIVLSVLMCVTFSCKKDSTPSGPYKPPTVTISSFIRILEDSPINYALVTVSLSNISDSTISVHYSTEDSTAIATTDYIAIPDGKLTFKPGETKKTFTVVINADTISKDLVFHVNMTSATNANLSSGKLRVVIVNVDYKHLVWSDEFSAASLNTSDWNYETGNNNGWGNQELETYSNSTDNVFIDNGILNIKAINTGNGYTSGRITTNGKQQFTYGRVEIRAQLPKGKGIWPALWMLGSNIGTVGWPACGEIDMMELLGDNPAKTYGTVHCGTSGHLSSGFWYILPSGAFSDDFHIFTLTWTPNNFSWFVDGTKYYNVAKASFSAFPFDLPEFFIFNVAVGGQWPGNPDNTTVFPQTMLVDYIRVYH